MPIRRLTPDERELLRRREELAAIRTTLAERELELIDLRSELADFEDRYLREVDTLRAELDEWQARTAELTDRLDPSTMSKAQAAAARQRARQSHEKAGGEASTSHNFTPSAELQRIYLDAVKANHPNFARDPGDRDRRTQFMVDANRAYEAGDAPALQRALEEYRVGAEPVTGEELSVELSRLAREIGLAKARISAIGQELADMRQSEKQTEERGREGRDLLAEQAATIREQIGLAKDEYEKLGKRDKPT